MQVDRLRDGEYLGWALVQAVFSGGLAQTIHDTGKHGNINIWHLGNWEDYIRAGLEAQIAPLLPFTYHGAGDFVVYPETGGMDVCLHMGQATPAAGSVLWLRERVVDALWDVLRNWSIQWSVYRWKVAGMGLRL
jgi:hypothetical protein